MNLSQATWRVVTHSDRIRHICLSNEKGACIGQLILFVDTSGEPLLGTISFPTTTQGVSISDFFVGLAVAPLDDRAYEVAARRMAGQMEPMGNFGSQSLFAFLGQPRDRRPTRSDVDDYIRICVEALMVEASFLDRFRRSSGGR